MFPLSMPRSQLRPEDSHLDLSHTLEQHILAGFPQDLALDLVLNELVVRANEATHANAAALALTRGDDLVCRAATGHLAPDLGVTLNPRDGLSGACLQTRQPQLSVDTEFDPRVDQTISRLGIRSILIVPVFDADDSNAQTAGILEIFSHSPAAFSHTEQKVLEGFAKEYASVRHAATELRQNKPAAELLPPEFMPPEFIATGAPPARRPPYEAWVLVLGALTILATIAVSFLIGSRIGWLSRATSHAQISQPIPASSTPAEPIESAAAATKSPGTKSSAPRTTPAASAKSTPVAPLADDELVVYEKGKIIFRSGTLSAKPTQAKNRQAQPAATKPDRDAIVAASSTARIAPIQSVWLDPEEAEKRLLSSTEPEYSPEARAAHRAGNVVLEVQVAEDGRVSSVRTLSGDPVLAAAAAQAVRTWRYQPYRQHDRPSQFQTDVTLSFAPSN